MTARLLQYSATIACKSKYCDSIIVSLHELLDDALCEAQCLSRDFTKEQSTALTRNEMLSKAMVSRLLKIVLGSEFYCRKHLPAI